MLRTEFREFAPFFVPQNGILSYFLFRGMVGNGIPSICFYFCSMERIQVVFFSAEWFRTDSESLLLLTAWTLPEQTNCSVYSVFRRINFLSEIANPTLVLLIPLANNWKKTYCLQLRVSLKEKMYLYVNSTTQRCPTNIIKTFLIEDFCQRHGRCTLSCKYLREFSKKFKRP
jgi:hypothetical protein